MNTFRIIAACMVGSLGAASHATTYYGSIRIDHPQIFPPPLYSNVVTTGPLNFAASAGTASAFVAANDANNGTVIAAGSTTLNGFYAEASYTAPLLFTGPTGSSVRVRLRAIGQIASMGTGDANVLFRVQNGSNIIFNAFRDVNSDTPTRVASVNWSTTFTLPANTPYTYTLNAWTRAAQLPTTDRTGSGYAFLDPVISFSSAVPEPGTWAMLIAGFGLVGTGMRRRREVVV